jgi:hypothetical protein
MNVMKDIVLINRAWYFAAQRHTIQGRKGKHGNTPNDAIAIHFEDTS